MLIEKKKLFCYVILIVVGFILYYPILNNQLLDFWDDQWVVMNFYTDTGVSWQNLWLILTTYYHGQYAPFNEFLYLFLHEAFGYNAFCFHLSSLILHVINVLLVYLVLDKLLALSNCKNGLVKMYLPFMTALIFLVTTVNVESVAWMSASKILVYALFYLLATYNFLLYLETNRRWKYLLLTYLFFICSFLGKEQAVTFPLFALLLYWFSGYSLKDKKVWLTLTPFFFLSLCFGFVTMLSQLATGGGALSSEATYPFWQRLIYGCYAFCEYFFKCLFPIKLSYLYPFPAIVGEAVPGWLYFYPAFIALFIFFFWKYICKDKMYLFGIMMFAIHIAVTLHIIPLSRFVVVADRYAYLSSIGVAFLLVYVLLILYRKTTLNQGFVLKALFVSYILYLGVYTNLRSRVWYDTDTLKKDMRELLESRDDFSEEKGRQKTFSYNL